MIEFPPGVADRGKSKRSRKSGAAGCLGYFSRSSLASTSAIHAAGW
jgi:hypothetical protein